MTGPAQIQIMGPVRVVRAAREVRIGGARERAVLASLVLDANRVVSVDRLIGAVWGGEPPASARSQVAICVSRLRRALSAVDLDKAVETASPGYLMRLDEHAADWPRFGSLTARAAAKAAAGDRLTAVALLREALDLWRGVPFEDLPGLRIEAHRLHEARLDAVETCAELELDLGRHDRIVAELSAVVAEQPLRERLRAQLMLAQYRSGRRAEALRTYQDARRVLVEQIGLEPGPELRVLHERILRDAPTLAPSPAAGNPVPAEAPATASAVPAVPAVPTVSAVSFAAPSTVPSQLPRQPVPFAGRRQQLRILDDALADRPDAPGTMVLWGPADVGKTALALRWAHERAEWFPHGQLYADLRDPQGSPVLASTVLDRFLHALGVPPQSVPGDLAEKVTLYRSVVARRKLLVVLDDAADSHQVVPLLPGCADCRVLVTSRDPLADLVVRLGARRSPVGPLQPGESWELLSLLLGEDWVGQRQRDAQRITGLSGGNPLLLRRAATADVEPAPATGPWRAGA
ncbi:AfsR/SARP family transcriptional regulator [Saccharomonospora xinjiangensis]|uniref:DNA-binding transcriptional activator of the SARP family n=1 Tax=Saccharomonospora xinjiangensis XJ-54 TaxID=882086 RepID=I0V5H1_9PSEU|nr:AfsR/SARP family transcriptional regulator [Saccharomonospora xinjiangensis]EID55374.1 DNA-binding transcriptional activator of the SARP family [Saccharomonospora xinjiangensis XJ-54]